MSHATPIGTAKPSGYRSCKFHRWLEFASAPRHLSFFLLTTYYLIATPFIFGPPFTRAEIDLPAASRTQRIRTEIAPVLPVRCRHEPARAAGG